MFRFRCCCCCCYRESRSCGRSNFILTQRNKVHQLQTIVYHFWFAASHFINNITADEDAILVGKQLSKIEFQLLSFPKRSVPGGLSGPFLFHFVGWERLTEFFSKNEKMLLLDDDDVRCDLIFMWCAVCYCRCCACCTAAAADDEIITITKVKDSILKRSGETSLEVWGSTLPPSLSNWRNGETSKVRL
jgi:hypothetical protein